MLLSEPQQTHYDLNFDFLGFRVRIHPGFFILPIVFGAGLAQNNEFNPGIAITIFILVFFLSILMHELGHTIAFRAFGVRSRIVLYWLGGLAIPESGFGRTRALSSNQQIIVSAAGPLAGILLGALFAGVVLALNGGLQFAMNGLFPVLIPDLSKTGFAGNQALFLFFTIGLFCNIFWSLLNLAPVLPLDGGQISNELFQQFDRRNGARNALMLSVFAAAIIAVLGFSTGDQMMGLFFAVMGISSFMTLQQMSGYGGGRY